MPVRMVVVAAPPPPEENWEVLEVWVGGRAPWEKLEGSGAGGVVVGRW